jgi:hypothetical protein
MTAQKASSPRLPGSAPATSGRKAWVKKSPVQVVLAQIDRLKADVAKDEEALKDKRRQLTKLEEARKLLES